MVDDDNYANMSINITERRKTEEKLLESEQKWHSLFELSPVGVSIVDSKNRVTDANQSLSQILGLSKEAILNGEYSGRKYYRSDRSLMPADEFSSLRAIKEQTVLRNVEVGIEKEDGTMNWTSISSAPLFSGDGSVTVTVDITQRKQLEEALIAAEEHLRSIISAAPLVLFDLNNEGIIQLADGNALVKLGLTHEILNGLSIFELFKDNSEAVLALRSGLAGAEFSAELKISESYRIRSFTRQKPGSDARRERGSRKYLRQGQSVHSHIALEPII